MDGGAQFPRNRGVAQGHPQRWLLSLYLCNEFRCRSIRAELFPRAAGFVPGQAGGDPAALLRPRCRPPPTAVLLGPSKLARPSGCCSPFLRPERSKRYPTGWRCTEMPGKSTWGGGGGAGVSGGKEKEGVWKARVWLVPEKHRVELASRGRSLADDPAGVQMGRLQKDVGRPPISTYDIVGMTGGSFVAAVWFCSFGGRTGVRLPMC